MNYYYESQEDNENKKTISSVGNEEQYNEILDELQTMVAQSILEAQCNNLLSKNEMEYLPWATAVIEASKWLAFLFLCFVFMLYCNLNTICMCTFIFSFSR